MPFRKITVDDAPKDNGPKEDDNVLKGSSFDGVWHSLRINPTLSNDTKKTNELGKDASSKDESDNDYTGRDNSEETSVKDKSKEDEIASS
eukprot:15338304-Ditylum_brightwellii.AAC.1